MVFPLNIQEWYVYICVLLNPRIFYGAGAVTEISIFQDRSAQRPHWMLTLVRQIWSYEAIEIEFISRAFFLAWKSFYFECGLDHYLEPGQNRSRMWLLPRVRDFVAAHACTRKFHVDLFQGLAPIGPDNGLAPTQFIAAYMKQSVSNEITSRDLKAWLNHYNKIALYVMLRTV